MPTTNVLTLGGIPTEVGAVWTDGQCLSHGADRGNPSSTVFIVGCGPIGCFAVGIARAAA
jgi:threonine dehydrogenase-like Zn-dependent dehydrogenase